MEELRHHMRFCIVFSIFIIALVSFFAIFGTPAANGMVRWSKTEPVILPPATVGVYPNRCGQFPLSMFITRACI